MRRMSGMAWGVFLVVNVCVIVLIGFSIWLTGTLYPLWGLVFCLFTFAVLEPTSIETECPECGHEFTATEDEDEYDPF